MKQRITFYTILLSGFLMLIGLPQAKASHIMGGDITYNCVGPNTFAFTVQLYRDCNGVAMPSSIPLTITSASCGQTINITLELVPSGPVIVTPLCPGVPDACNNGSGVYGIQQYTYTHIPASQGQGLSSPVVTLPAGCTDWTISWTSCCRNTTITTGPSNDAFYIETTLNNVNAPCNNSPAFLNTPTPYACVGTNVNYSHGVSEWDGDSLAFSLIPCMTNGPGQNVSYIAPYSGTNPLASASGVTINSQTGAITFTPTQAQVAVICVLVREFRNGVQVGSVMRDIQFTILNCNNSLPLASGANGTAGATGATGSYDVSVCEGETVDFLVRSYDALGTGQTTGKNVNMSWNGGINSSNASFTVFNNNTDSTRGNFKWTTNKGDAGFYIFTVNLQDDACPINGVNIFTFTVTIHDVPDVDAGGYQISCTAGDTLTLNAVATSVDSLYQWNALNGGTILNPTSLVTGVVPVVGGSYQLIKTYEYGCIDSNVVAIDISPNLQMPVIPDANLCLGGSVQLNATINVTTNPPTTFTNSTVVPFGQTPDTAYSYINVTGLQPGIFNPTMLQSVCMNINYPFNSFLSINLISPNGTSIILSSNNGGANANYTNTCFSPTATTPITSGSSPFTGSYLPELPFSNFNGDVVNGTWKLQVITSTGIPIPGLQITNWSMTFLDITGTMSYAWTPPTALSCTTCPNPVANPTTPTVYQVTTTDYFNCTNTQSVFIDIISALTAPTVTCCQVSTTALTFCWGAIAGANSYEVSINNGVTWTPANGTLQHQLTGLALGQSVTILVRGIGTCPGVAPIGTQTCTTTPCTLTASLGGSTNVSCNGGSNGTISVTASGGTAPYTFQITGFPTNNTGNFINLPAGSYTVNVTDVNGCLINVPAVITEPTAITFSTATTPTSCNGGSDGTASVILANGGTGTLTYQWGANAANQTTATATGLTAGTYNFTITDANNCTATGSQTVTQPTLLTLTQQTVAVSCNSAMDGTATVSPTGGTPGTAPNLYTYAWTPNANGQTTATVTGLNGGSYTVTVTDANGCTQNISMTVAEASPIVLITSMTQATCNGLADGTATVNATGGTPGANPNQYTYSWSASANNQTTATATTLNTGVHTVTVTDGAGCTKVASVTVTAPPSMTLTTTSVPSTSCSYSTDGTATVIASGGAGGYTYQWSAGNAPTNTASITGLATGTTYVTVTDVNGCSDIDTVVIAGPPAVVANPTATAISCNGANDGTITLAPTGGTGTLSYAWSNGVNTQNIATLSAGTYTVTITDANNCIFNASATITEPTLLQVSATMTPVSCFGGINGTATALPTGGQGGYNYNWSSSSTDSIALILSAGTYTITVTDGAGCTATTNISVTQPATAVSSTISGTNLTCNANASGTATVVPSGGTVGTGYTYLWGANANNQTTATATTLPAGTFNVTVTDGNGCTTTNSVTITQPTAIAGTATGTPTTCFGAADGTASISPTGGTPGTAPNQYTYQWGVNAANQTTATATGLIAGTYTVTVTDANNCTHTSTFQVTQPTAITTTTSTTAVLCNGGATGTATVTATGGTPFYTYLWSASANNQTTATATGLAAGTYTVTVTDANMCTSVATVTVTEPTVLTSSTTVANVLCFGAATGSATVTGAGGTIGTGYTYQWSVTAGSQTTQTATALTAGIYSVTVTDANGCTSVSSATITQPTTPITSTISGTNLTCNGNASGTATVLPSGGTIGAGYTYLWGANANNQTTATATALPAGTFNVTVTDGNGCTTTNTVTITQPAVLTGTTTGTATTCFGIADGTATITATGGTAPYTYQWGANANNQTTATATALIAGTYNVTVTDANTCTFTNSFQVTQPIGITTVMSTTPVLCNGGATGTAAVNATGGNGGFTYAWSPSTSTTTNATALAAGWHYVTVTDLNGCFTIDSIQVTEPTGLTLTTTQINVGCFGQATGSATVIATGGVIGNGYTYQWDAATGNQISQTATNLPAGAYSVIVTDANGCTQTISVNITQPASGVDITAISTTQVSCFGGSNGTATVQVTGGAGNYTYNWTPTGQTTQTATGLAIGTYIVIVTDINGCFDIDSATIDQPSPITTIFTNVTGSSCHQGNDGTATIAASGGIPIGTNGYTYLWNTIPQQQGATATNLIGGQTYTVIITDANGCSTNNQVTIPQPDPVTLTTTQTNVSCFGFTDATATVIPAGGTPGFTFQWDANAGNQTNPTATGLPFGNYAVTVTDFFGCAAVIGVTITQPAELVTNESTVDILCKGTNTGEAQVLMSGGTAPYYITWQGGFINPPTNLAAGNYIYSVRDSKNCQLTDTITINEPANALTAQKEAVDVTCYNDRDGVINIYPNGGTAPYQYSLNGINYDDNDEKIGLTAGEYTFYVKDDNGCIYTETVTIGEPDEFTIDLGADVNIELGESVNLEVITTNGIPNYTYLWTPTENLSCTDCATPTVDSLQDDRYITVMVTDQRGCQAEDDIYIRITKPRYVFIANAFTPNADGNNDYLFVQGGNGTERVVSFRVYDRWGELVFEVQDGLLNDTNYGWNGRFKDQDLNAGVFVWVAEVEFEDGETLIYKGSTVLIK
jgi:large repetitive protein